MSERKKEKKKERIDILSSAFGYTSSVYLYFRHSPYGDAVITGRSESSPFLRMEDLPRPTELAESGEKGSNTHRNTPHKI